MLLMALSNKFGRLVLSTGNKKRTVDGLLHLVRRHVRWFGRHLGPLEDPGIRPGEVGQPEGEKIPEATLIKAPSAELKPHQIDQDTLPPYEELDAVLKAYVVENKDIAGILRSGPPRRGGPSRPRGRCQ